MPPSSATRPGVTTALAAFATLSAVVGAIHYLEIPSLLSQRRKARQVTKRNYSPETDKYSLAAFRTLTSQLTLPETYPLAQDVEKNIPIYDGRTFDLNDGKHIESLKDEFYHILYHGPGVFVIKNFFTDLSTIDATNTAYSAIIARELAEHGAKGDHFAPASANSRIWNSFSKHCLQDPDSFLAYHSNPLFQLVSEAYLGPGYRMTTQVNVVRPGGKAQTAHRDYHLGFQTESDVARWPKEMHDASRLLTLQGAVAHTDMPLDSGPTRFLPYSQGFGEGFVAYRRKEFGEFFEGNYVSLPLRKGDAVFFSPALFHAAGENRTNDFERSANLIQVSSAFGKTMETVDSLPLVDKTWDLLCALHARCPSSDGQALSQEVETFVAAVAEGYPFPCNLDRRPPAPGGMAPESEQDVLRRGIREGWSRERVVGELTAMREASAA